MTYVVSNEGLIVDPYALQEFQQIQATLKRIEEALNRIGDPEDPDNGGGGGNPPGTETPPEIIGQRWLTGPWVLGLDGAGIPTRPYYSVVKPPEWDSDQHNFWCNGLDNAVMLEAYPSTTVRLTGIRVAARNRRLLALYNRDAGDLKIVNDSNAESSAQYCFSWGDSGDIGEEITIPSGIVVWLLYDARTQRWKLFAIPPVGVDNLPPSLGPGTQSSFPPDYDWMASRWYRETTSGGIGIGEQAPAVTGTLAAVVTTEGNGIKTTTGAVAGNTAGTGTGTPATSIQPVSGPDWVTIMETGSSLTDVRIWVVWSTITPSNTDDLPGGGTAQHFGFRYSTVAGDGGWVGSSRDGTTQSVTSTVAAIAVNTRYKLRVRKSGTSLFFSVNDSDEIEKTANLPSDTISLNWYCYIITTGAATKFITWYRHHCRFLATQFAPA
jgi:hypothetical protein